MYLTVTACSSLMINSPFGPLSYPRNLENETLAFPSANDFLFPHVVFSEMDLDSSCASGLKVPGAHEHIYSYFVHLSFICTWYLKTLIPQSPYTTRRNPFTTTKRTLPNNLIPESVPVIFLLFNFPVNQVKITLRFCR